mmetsp:Transcript_39583/g.76947  ORF Transcript_39583/g.76947 Transcript_39583/m.76947 type:complete len:116 (-) Transcript_39583:21-368(-)
MPRPAVMPRPPPPPRRAIMPDDRFFMRKELPGAQIVFPEFGLAVALATVADEMAHNNGGAHGDYQSLRSIEKSELVTKIEKKFGVDLHDSPNPDDATPVSMEGSASVNDTIKKFR